MMTQRATMRHQNERNRVKVLTETLAAKFARVDRISTENAHRLIALLEAAPDEALQILWRRRVKFCHMIAARILVDRGIFDGDPNPRYVRNDEIPSTKKDPAAMALRVWAATQPKG